MPSRDHIMLREEACTDRPCFTLSDEEVDLEGEDEVALASVALSSLQILPSLAPCTSGSWDLLGIGGGRCTPLAASARSSCLRRSRSVLLALTDVRSLASFSPFAVGLVGGGVGVGMGLGTDRDGWRPSGDGHAMGELR
jgi:hypothetical protein